MVKIKRLFITLAILVILAFSASFAFIQFKKQRASNNVMEYLTEVKGYEKSQIVTLESKWSFFGIPKYYVEVSFKNEPNIIYLYLANDLKGQFEYYAMDVKTIPTKDLKNYDPVGNTN